ncbi:VOC family protein [Paenibacillus dendritiformis]|uniref:Glyoxalase/bleomycin resistance protein/dioxygenase n=1 Tax=Paenibacillus dendritiformis C454 TaxID=1131935 RepID=H3SLS4_9BACL|nr:hypothetical protein [Paenibacillus dendritiformis]EHQ59986.1 hypothetical protein PDENDC454_22564 [Paenibacillus dendritiformis C454]CAH8770863.1 hypothetical protein H7S4_003598 [Paenibacillus dendritiformis]
MSHEIWINLLVKDVERSTAFFNEIRFHAVSVGNERAKLAILLFPDAALEKFRGSKTADASHSAEVIISIGAESREEVDAFIQRAMLKLVVDFCFKRKPPTKRRSFT